MSTSQRSAESRGLVGFLLAFWFPSTVKVYTVGWVIRANSNWLECCGNFPALVGLVAKLNKGMFIRTCIFFYN